MAETENTVKRIMPHDSDAERSVIASMLMDKDSLDKACELLNADDFSSDVLKRLLTALESGRPVNAFIGELEDEEERGAAMRALNYEPLPEDRETALAMAEASLKTIRRARMEARIEQIKQEINSASPERRAELYEQMTAILSEMGS